MRTTLALAAVALMSVSTVAFAQDAAMTNTGTETTQPASPVKAAKSHTAKHKAHKAHTGTKKHTKKAAM